MQERSPMTLKPVIPLPGRTPALVDLAQLEFNGCINARDYANKFLNLREEIVLANGKQITTNLSEKTLIYLFVGGLSDQRSERLRFILRSHRLAGKDSTLTLQYFIDLFLEGETEKKQTPPVDVHALSRTPSLDNLKKARRAYCSVHGGRCDERDGTACLARRPPRPESISSSEHMTMPGMLRGILIKNNRSCYIRPTVFHNTEP